MTALLRLGSGLASASEEPHSSSTSRSTLRFEFEIALVVDVAALVMAAVGSMVMAIGGVSIDCCLGKSKPFAVLNGVVFVSIAATYRDYATYERGAYTKRAEQVT